MNKEQNQQMSLPRQLGDSHSLSFPEGDELWAFFGKSVECSSERPLPDTFTD